MLEWKRVGLLMRWNTELVFHQINELELCDLLLWRHVILGAYLYARAVQCLQKSWITVLNLRKCSMLHRCRDSFCLGTFAHGYIMLAASQPRVFVINASKRCTVEHEINLRVAVGYCFSSYASLVFSTCLQSKLDEKVFVNFFDWRYRTVIKWRVSKCD